MASSLVDINTADGPQPLTIITKMHTSTSLVEENVRVNIKRDLPRFRELPGLLHARHKPLAIIGGGPSLNKHVDRINQFENVLVCGSTHDHLVSLGIVPNFALAVDAAEDAGQWIRNPQERTSYLLASQCSPSLYEQLEDHKIAMWHFGGQVDDESIFNGEPQINWGCMVGVLSIQIAIYLGFQELHFFGFDCSYIDGEHHSYDVGKYHQEVEEKKDAFCVNGKTFASTMALISQAEHLFDVFASPDGRFIKGYVYGDGLWANVIKASPPEMSEWLEAVC